MPFDASRAPAALLSSLAGKEADGASRNRPSLRPAEEDRLVYTLSVAAESWCGCAPGHLTRVARLSVILGQEFGFSGVDLTVLRHGALLHDLGKLGVSESVLTKPAPLTAEEFVEIRRHPEIGADILKRLNLRSPVCTLVLQHHEWYDGRGYPHGLVGEDITFGARILAVADTFDALTTDRPYRKARKHDEALEEVRLRSGVQFDPLVVRALLELAEELPLPADDSEELHTERSASQPLEEQTDEEPCGVN